MKLIISDGDQAVASTDPYIEVGAAAQDAVVYRFNPSNVGRVQRVKLLAAALVQEVNNEAHDRASRGGSHTWNIIHSMAVDKIMTACMWAVRVVTDGR